jgi:Asp-tRNA(Asn)/Glu-tRNA(Gln) amidotransferase A subunit family amidase
MEISMAKKTSAESRRKFLKAVPAAMAGAVGAKVLAQGPPPPAGPVNAAAVDCAEKIAGLEFHAAEEEAIARTLNQNLNAYQQMRAVTIPHDTEVALVFKPTLPGKAVPKGPATPGRAMKYAKPAITALKRPPNLEDVAFWPVTKLAALVERKLVTSAELTRMYLDRLNRYQPRLNFAVTITEELALKQAADADREIAAGKYKGPLHGIPWGGKDLLSTKDIKTTWGAHPYMDQVFDFDATVVERLRDAGAVLVAKLTLGALAQGDQWFGGRTNNPWNVQQGSSGSSAGPGSATAAGCVGFSIGTETRGSIISPTAVNGVVGLRPTYGRVSRYGAMELSWTMDKIGPMCRSVEDCVLVLNAIYGPDGRDNSVADVPFTWNPDLPLSSLRIGYVRADFEAQPAGRGGAPGGAPAGAAGGGGRGAGTPADNEARLKMMQDVLGVFEKLGAKLEPIELPAFNANSLNFLLSVEAAAAFDELLRSRGTDLMERSTWPATFRAARFVPAVEYLRGQRIRTMLMREWDTFMSKYDAFISSNGAGLAQTNLTGHPAIALKCGFVNDLPRVLMVTGRLYDEGTICRIAQAYEQATDWKDRNPKL